MEFGERHNTHAASDDGLMCIDDVLHQWRPPVMTCLCDDMFLWWRDAVVK